MTQFCINAVAASVLCVLQGRPSGGTDKLVDVSHDDCGEYVPEQLDESTMSQDPTATRRAPTSNGEEDMGPISADNLVNGSLEMADHCDTLPDGGSTSRMPHGAQLHRKPVPVQRSVNGIDQIPVINGYDSHTACDPQGPAVEEQAITSAGAPQVRLTVCLYELCRAASIVSSNQTSEVHVVIPLISMEVRL